MLPFIYSYILPYILLIIALSDSNSYPALYPSSYYLPHLQNLHGLILYIFPLQHHQVIRVSFNMVLSSLSTPSTSRCSRWPYPQPGTLLGQREPSWPTPWAWQSLKSRFEMDDYDHNSRALKNIRLNPKQNTILINFAMVKGSEHEKKRTCLAKFSFFFSRS